MSASYLKCCQRSELQHASVCHAVRLECPSPDSRTCISSPQHCLNRPQAYHQSRLYRSSVICVAIRYAHHSHCMRAAQASTSARRPPSWRHPPHLPVKTDGTNHSARAGKLRFEYNAQVEALLEARAAIAGMSTRADLVNTGERIAATVWTQLWRLLCSPPAAALPSRIDAAPGAATVTTPPHAASTRAGTVAGRQAWRWCRLGRGACCT